MDDANDAASPAAERLTACHRDDPVARISFSDWFGGITIELTADGPLSIWSLPARCTVTFAVPELMNSKIDPSGVDAIDGKVTVTADAAV
jgi:hypothetical protein